MLSVAVLERVQWVRLTSTLITVYVMPVLLILAGVIPFQWRFHLLMLMCATVAVLAFVRGYSFSSTDSTGPRLSTILAWSIAPAVFLIAGLWLSNLPHRLVSVEHLPFYLFFVLVSAPAQEFLYRSFLFAELMRHGLPSGLLIIVSALLFAWMHVIYKDPLTLAFTFVAGLIFGAVFLKTRSFCAVALSHAALGVVAIYLGVV